MSATYYPSSSSSRRRLVCLTCHQKNITYEAHPQAPSMPCARCARKGLVCQYTTNPSPAPAPTAQTRVPASSYYNTAPELPYTAPPPMYSRPRYSGSAYPDLSLANAGAAPVTPCATHAQLSGSGGYAHPQAQAPMQGYAHAHPQAGAAYPNMPYTSSYPQGYRG